MKPARRPLSISDLVPGGIKPGDFVHVETNDGTCSRCRRYDHESVPLMVWLDPPANTRLLIYCEACIGENAWAGEAPIAPAD